MLDNSNNIWTGWVIQMLPLIAAAQFTIWYPQRLDALGRQAQAEERGDGPVPAPAQARAPSGASHWCLSAETEAIRS